MQQSEFSSYYILRSLKKKKSTYSETSPEK